MSDWYEEGKDQLIKDTSEETGLTEDQVKSVYSYLESIGIIDYDIEKDVIREMYDDEEEE